MALNVIRAGAPPYAIFVESGFSIAPIHLTRFLAHP
jgi:hypothetical protein